jgi:hypothetical protein
MGKNLNIASYFHSMKKATLEALKYPVGEFKMPKKISDKEIALNIKTIANFPAKLKKEVGSLNNTALAYRHRLGGWTIRQLVHHSADSHMTAFTRIKLAYTEKNPTVKPYDESAWANTDDAGEAPVEWSLQMLDGLHKRWVVLLSELNEEDFKRTLYHPERKEKLSISFLLFLYAWHCDHHLAHVQQAKKYKNKFS